MGLLSSPVLITAHSLTLILISYFLLYNPSTLLAQPSLELLGEAMHLRPATYEPSNYDTTLPASLQTTPPTPQANLELLAVIALLLFSLGVFQTIFSAGLFAPSHTTSEGGRVPRAQLEGQYTILIHYQTRWLSFCALRFLFVGGLAVWIYLFHSSRNILSETSLSAPKEGLGLLANRVTFSVGMVEMSFWGYIWGIIRQEAREVRQHWSATRDDE